MKYEGYEKRKLELEVTKRYKNGEIKEVSYDTLMDYLDNGDLDLVHNILYDDGYKLSFEEETRVKTKPDPLNLSWEEAEVLDEYLTTNTGSLDSVEKIKILEGVHDKVRDVIQ